MIVLVVDEAMKTACCERTRQRASIIDNSIPIYVVLEKQKGKLFLKHFVSKSSALGLP